MHLTTLAKATVERRYKDGDEWKSSSSFGRNEIPLALWCLQKAFDHIIEHATDRNDDSSDDDTVVYPGHGDDTTLGNERPHVQEWRERGW